MPFGSLTNSPSESGIEDAVKDLEYFRDEMIRSYEKKELSENELIDLKGFVNTIITHITNGNKNEERLVNVMGGTVIETESERLIRVGKSEGLRMGRNEGLREGKAQLLIEMGQEEGLADAAILKKLQDRIGLSMEQAVAYLEQYGK